MADFKALDANDPRIMAARGLAMTHRIAEAEALYREILQDAPDTPEALNFVALCELGRGEFRLAQQCLERALRVDANEADLWKNLGIALLAQERAQDAVDAFDRVLSMEPKSLPARLHRAAALERMGHAWDAAAAYEGAMARARSDGRWRSEATTPAALRPLVRHAMNHLLHARKRLFSELMQPVRAQYGADAVARVEQGLAIYLDGPAAESAPPRQQCSFFWVPGLSTQPFLDATLIPGLAELAAQHRMLRAELDAAIAAGVGIEPYFGTNDLAFLREQRVLEGPSGARFEAFFLWRQGAEETLAHHNCQRALAAIAALPEPVRIRALGPDAFFAMVAPGTHVLGSHGITNARVSVEIPLGVEGRCVRTVAGQERPWREGECVVFDPSFEHELLNSGEGACSALVLDAWHPGLSRAERAALTLLFEGLREFNLAAGVTPPFGAP